MEDRNAQSTVSLASIASCRFGGGRYWPAAEFDDVSSRCDALELTAGAEQASVRSLHAIVVLQYTC